MPFLIKKTWSAPLPRGATVEAVNGTRIATWLTRSGEARSAEVIDGARGPRIRGRTRGYVARYRDAQGVMQERSTGCRDLKAARAVLHRFERQVERVRAGLLTTDELEASEHGQTRFAQHVADYTRHLELRGGAARRINQVQARLDRLASECRIARLADLTPAAIEPWLAARRREGMSAGTLAGYRQVVVALANWAVKGGRLLSHRLDQLPRASSKVDQRRRRRALDEQELARLLDAARTRPLHEALLVRRGARKGELAARVRPHIRRRLELVGMERALAYLVLATTGLRRSELASIAIAQVVLDASTPHLLLAARAEKSRRGATIPLRHDVAEEVRRWTDARLERERDLAERLGRPLPESLASKAKLLSVPTIRVFDADLAFAGIAKIDDQDRTVDLHCLRVSFCTHLARAGVALATAQRAMRHSTPVLTANTYTDPALLDVAGAMERLPSLVREAGPRAASA